MEIKELSRKFRAILERTMVVCHGKSCPAGGKPMFYSDLEKHTIDCKDKYVKCPLKCGT